MPEFVGKTLKEAKKSAKAKGYELIVSDSLHIIGKKGGIILAQVPEPGNKVKRGRAIYITTTRYNPDIILSESLPSLYGKKFEHKRPVLENAFEIQTKIIGFKFDPGPPGHILEVRFKNEIIVDAESKRMGISIAKGDTLGFVLSQQQGGDIELPDLACISVAEARFLLEASRLEIGQIEEEGSIENAEEAFVIKQEPAFASGKKIKMGQRVNLTISQTKPESCN
ncbi:MAG: PASTA domain-containing protein [Bacteroidota bacterium]|nr:PASTA domain-containing protein [Bacteroidota bacterium]